MTAVDFGNPPVTEVVVGIAFKSMAELTIPRLCELWHEKWRPTFPKTQEHPPYLPPIERFNVPSSGPTLSLELLDRPASRLWFVTQDDQELIQVQREWFACNWRKVSPGDTYDRWPARRKAFSGYLNDLETFVTQEKLGRITATQCEVTYVNHIPIGEGWDRLGELSKVLRVVAPLNGTFPPEPEQMQLSMAFAITDERKTRVGRLHVTAQPAIRKEDRKPMIILNLTARGRPEDESNGGILTFLDRGRDWIVRTFKEITTEQMHKTWRLRA